MKFEMIERLREQKERKSREAQEFETRIRKASEEVARLKHEYEQTVLKSVREGRDLTKEIDRISEELEQAEKALKRRQEERAAYYAVHSQGDIKTEDVIRAWNEDFLPMVKKERLNPTLKRMLQAKRDLIHATLEYLALTKEVDDIKNEVVREAGEGVRYKLRSVSLQTRPETEKYFVTLEDLRYLERGEIPRSFQYVDPKEYE